MLATDNRVSLLLNILAIYGSRNLTRAPPAVGTCTLEQQTIAMKRV